MKSLVTGASSGIGRDIAIYLSEKGYDVILVGRNIESLKETQSKIKTNTKLITLDLSTEENCYKLYELVKNEDIDILVNNAGFGLLGNTWDLDLTKEIEMINTNIIAVHILTKLFLNDMLKKDSGYILNVSSSASFFSGPLLNTYYATKNYVTKWTLGIYEELRHIKSNVRVSVLCPGPVDTHFSERAGVSFSLKGLSSSYVAKYAIDKMFKNKLIIIPGLKIKLGIFFNRFIPYKQSLKIVYKLQHKKTNKKEV